MTPLRQQMIDAMQLDQIQEYFVYLVKERDYLARYSHRIAISDQRIVGHCIDRCPRCKIGRLKIVKTIHRRARAAPRPDTMLASKRSAPTHYRACIRHTLSLQSPYTFLQFCPTVE